MAPPPWNGPHGSYHGFEPPVRKLFDVAVDRIRYDAVQIMVKEELQLCILRFRI